MKEILEKRGYNRKVFQDEKLLKYRFSTAHKHYKDKDGNFQEINTYLSFDQEKRKFIITKASYNAEIPEYADEVIGFKNLYDGKNHEISAKPLCRHIKGQVFNNQPDGNYVLYRNAFRDDVDLRIYAYHHGLKEVVVINKKLEDLSNLFFDFEILVDNSIEFKNKEGITWNKTESLVFKDKTIKLNHLNDRGSFFRVAQVWDSNYKIEPVDIELYSLNEKIYLRKTISKKFLESSVFPVYTDHATSYYSGAGDGHVDARKFIDFTSAWGQSNWDYIHDQDHEVNDFEGSIANYTGAWVENGPYVASGEIRLQRAFVPIDTSGIDDGATIESASLFMWCAQKFDNQNDSLGYSVVVNTTSASTSTLALTDFDNCGDAIDDPTEGSDRIDITNIDDSDTVYTEFTLNATGIGWINKTGTTKLGIRQGLDVEDVVPNNNMNGERSIFRSSETTGTNNDPYLEVTLQSNNVEISQNSLYRKGVQII